jgi:hypothetical protein
MDSRYNPLRHLDLASQHYMMQVLGWMWSMVFCLSFLSIFEFGLVWMSHLLLFGGVCFTVAVFKEAERQSTSRMSAIEGASRSVWMLDKEA